MTIELLYFDGCPSFERFLPHLRRLLAENEVGDEVTVRRVASPEDAIAERFLGSPTLRVDGVDIEPDARARTDFGLKCRLYRCSGRLQGVPCDELILAALPGPRAA